MITLATSFLIGSSSFLQVTRTCIKARMSSNFGQIMPLNTELTAIERIENEKSPYTYNGRDDVNTLAISFFDGIFFILAGDEDMHKSLEEFEFRPDHTIEYGVSCP